MSAGLWLHFEAPEVLPTVPLPTRGLPLILAALARIQVGTVAQVAKAAGMSAVRTHGFLLNAHRARTVSRMRHGTAHHYRLT